MKKLLLFLTVIALYGCTSAPITYQKYGASDSEIRTARLECEYDVAKSTQNNRYLFSLGDAIASGINEGMEKNRLMELCLRSKGFARTYATRGTATVTDIQDTKPTAGNPPNGKGL